MNWEERIALKGAVVWACVSMLFCVGVSFGDYWPLIAWAVCSFLIAASYVGEAEYLRAFHAEGESAC